MTDYFIDSVLNVSFYFGILSVNVPKELFEIDTTVLDAALLGQMSKNGYNSEMPC